MTRRFKQVDVFTDTIGLGNPVAVVLDGDGLTDDEMAQFARWTNLSETTFVCTPSDPDADYHVRIFTPTEELPFAGHPTVGTCHAWLEAGGSPKRPGIVVQECGVGLVTLRRDDNQLAFATPPLIRSGPVDEADLQRAITALGLAEDEVLDSAWIDNGPGWLGIRIADPDRLARLRCELDARFKIGVVAVYPGGETGSVDPAIKVRAFFWAGNSREDPVTGSLNGSIAQWLLGDGTLQAPYVSSQGREMQRDGRVSVTEADGEIWIGGSAVTGVDGHVHL